MANGFDGYIKFANQDIKEKLTDVKIMSDFHLDDNMLIFEKVERYIDGLQKNLWLTIMWYGISFLLLMSIAVAILITLAWIYRIVNREKINVKKFLGFNFWKLYRFPILCLVGFSVLELIFMITMRSKFGLLILCTNLFIQFLILWRYMMKTDMKQILISFKGGE
ncbi:MAG: hypothetical protein ACK5KR_06625 [Breznakia sp.]